VQADGLGLRAPRRACFATAPRPLAIRTRRRAHDEQPIRRPTVDAAGFLPSKPLGEARWRFASALSRSLGLRTSSSSFRASRFRVFALIRSGIRASLTCRWPKKKPPTGWGSTSAGPALGGAGVYRRPACAGGTQALGRRGNRWLSRARPDSLHARYQRGLRCGVMELRGSSRCRTRYGDTPSARARCALEVPSISSVSPWHLDCISTERHGEPWCLSARAPLRR